MNLDSFEMMLTGGHRNSLGRTIEVVDIVLSKQERLKELYRCYFSSDEVVRLRTSNAFKRISRENIEWLIPYIDKFIEEISQIDQASAQWTTAHLFQSLNPYMDLEQKAAATIILKNYLSKCNDWIVLNNTMQTLAEWAYKDEDLAQWILPNLIRLSKDSRKSVSKRASKLIELFLETNN